jgi:hypothetical protein
LRTLLRSVVMSVATSEIASFGADAPPALGQGVGERWRWC